MYSQFFGLHKNPFSQLVQQKHIFLPDSHQLILNQLVGDIDQLTGVIGLLGTAGVGKSAFVRRLVETVSPDKTAIVFKDLSTTISDSVWTETSQESFSNVLSVLLEDSQSASFQSSKSVYLLDAADTVPDISLIKLLKVIADRNASNRPTLLILVGRTILEQVFNHLQDVDDLTQLYYLKPLNETEVMSYLDHRIQSAHYSGPSLFTEEAINAITTLSEGIPRQINTICGMSLYQAAQEKLQVIGSEKIFHVSECCFFEKAIDLQPLATGAQPLDIFTAASDADAQLENSLIARTKVDQPNIIGESKQSTSKVGAEITSLQKVEELADPNDHVPILESEYTFDSDTKNKTNGYSLGLIGAFSFVFVVISVIAIQWTSAPQPVEQMENLEAFKQPEIWSPNTEAADTIVAENEVSNTIEEVHMALEVVDLEHAEEVQYQPIDPPSDQLVSMVENLLDQAKVMEQKNRLTLPENNNAIATYQQILDLQPENSDAIQGIERIKQYFIDQAERAIAQSQWKKARLSLLKAKRIDSVDPAADLLLAKLQLHQQQEEQATNQPSHQEQTVTTRHDHTIDQLDQTVRTSYGHTVDQHELAAKNRARARYRLNERGIDFDISNFFFHAEYGNAELIALFLDAEMPVDVQDTASGDTALIKSVIYGHPDAVKLMINRRANVNIQNRSGRTALMNAIIFEQYDIVYDLLNQAVDINVSDQNGWNALMLAVHKNQPALVEHLLRKGADIHLKNVVGQSALSIAEENKYNTITALLQSTP